MSESSHTPRSFRPFLLFWTTQSLSLLGGSLNVFCMTMWIALVAYPNPSEEGALSLALAAASFSFMLPNLIMAPYAGIIADRHSRKKIMFITDLMNAFISLALFILLLNGWLTIYLYIFLSVISGILRSFHQASFGASYVLLVPSNLLSRANGMMQTTFSVSRILAPAIGAALISAPPITISRTVSATTNGIAFAVLLDCASFVLASISFLAKDLSPLSRRSGTEVGRKQTFIQDILLGTKFIKSNQNLLWLLLTISVLSLAVQPVNTLIPLLVKVHLFSDSKDIHVSYATAVAILNSMAGIGSLLSSVAMSWWSTRIEAKVKTVMFCALFIATSIILLALSPWLILAATSTFMLYSLVPAVNTFSATLWQTNTPSEIQGRVFALRKLSGQITGPISVALTGWWASWTNVEVIFIVLGGILGISVLLCLAVSKTSHRVHEWEVQR
ncbi:MAG: MFS transporter [Thermoflavifilum sp.]|nr:MFS transporter [Thermoflavifilum sp.]